jgi:hypothetical protein
MKKSYLWQASLAITFALTVCVATGLIPAWGNWYSTNMAYRRQSDAFFDGHLRLSAFPGAVEHDMAWGEGGVQQLWALGVPAWRFLFECLARLVGQPAFPDRLAFAAALALVAFILLRSFSSGKRGDGVAAEHESGGGKPERLAAVALLLLFPPILSLYRGPFGVYEEAIAYGCLYSAGLFAGLVAFRRRPTLTLYLTLALLSGLAGFTRATMLAYGVATMLMAFIYTRFLGWKWRTSMYGGCLFVLGGSLLYWTNRVRFGSGTEFGQALQLTSLDLMYVSRFHAPFSDESFWSALRELIGSLFFVKRLNGYEVYGSDIVQWQSPTPRWRHFYDTTYDASYLALLAGAFALIAWRNLRGRKYADWLRWPNDSLLAGVWALLSIGPLALFYLRFFVISSRYMLDFAPAFAIAIGGGLMELGTVRARLGTWKELVRHMVFGALAAWGIWEVVTAQSYFPQEAPFSRGQMLEALNAHFPTVKSFPAHYKSGTRFADEFRINHNGKGWIKGSGETGSMVVLFVSSPEKVTVEVAPASDEKMSDQDYRTIRAKVGLEFLRLESVTSTPSGARLIFNGPRRAFYREGVQALFISFASPRDFVRLRSRFRLLNVWLNRQPLVDTLDDELH